MKFCIFLSLSICLIFYGVITPRQFGLENYFAGEYAFYSTDLVESPLVTRRQELGFSFIYFTRSEDAAELRRLFTRIDGESITLDIKQSTSEILKKLQARQVSRDRIGDLTTIYAYSPKVPTYIIVDGERINIQIAQANNRTLIGFPIILGSF